MIAFINGILIYKQAPNVIIDVAGVGYELLVPMSTYYNLPELDNKTKLYCHQYVREDVNVLYGFNNLEERKLFTELLKTNGVGPRMALTILSNYSVLEFIHIIESCDSSALVKLPGVGKKTADRLLLELRDKFKSIFGKANNLDTTKVHHSDTTVSDAISALESLGYKETEARKVVTKLASNYKDKYSSEMLIKDALREFM